MTSSRSPVATTTAPLRSESTRSHKRTFPGQHTHPDNLRFSNSPALDPGSDIQAALALEYEQSRFLYYGGFPTFNEIHARLDRYREIL